MVIKLTSNNKMVKNQKSAHHAQKKPTKRKTTPEKIVSNSVRNRLTHDSESIAHTSNLFEIIAEAIDIDTKEGHLFLEQMEQLS